VSPAGAASIIVPLCLNVALMADAVQYALPVGALGQLIHRIQVAADLSRIFDYRSECIRARFSPAKGGSVTIREASLQSATTS
jgi:hypothetical protein